MAVMKDAASNWDNENIAESVREERETSISARIVRSISVSMSYSEMDALVHSLGRSRDELTMGEKTLQAEFIDAVERIRFSG